MNSESAIRIAEAAMRMDEMCNASVEPDLMRQVVDVPDELQNLWAVVNTRQISERKRALNCLMEYDVHEWFETDYGSIVPGVRLIEFKVRGASPDFWVHHPTHGVCPVEIKKDVFDAAALRQLRRYMDVSGAKFGYGVANCKSVSLELPQDVSFVAYDPVTVLRHAGKEFSWIS